MIKLIKVYEKLGETFNKIKNTFVSMEYYKKIIEVMKKNKYSENKIE